MQESEISRGTTSTHQSAFQAEDPVLRANAAILTHLHTTCPLPPELVRPARFPALALMIARSGPWLPAADLAVLADIVLFIFAADDLADEGDLPLEDLAHRLDQYAACLAGHDCPELRYDPIARLASSIAARLAAAPLGAALWDAWSARASEFLASMITEKLLSAALASGRSVDLETYLDAGRQTVGVAVVSTAAWMLIGEPAMASAFPELRTAERHLSCAARLANDLRSQEREREEGSANAVFVVGPGGDAFLRRMLAEELALGRSQLSRRPAGADRSAAFLSQFVDFVISLYATHDFHTFPALGAAA
jgi:hypothetical protein